jgi:hypothetical protein
MWYAVLFAVLAVADPVGDAGGSPDVTRVVPSVAGGKLRVVVATADASAWTNAAAFLSLDLNGDGKTDVDYTFHSLHDLVTRDTAAGPVATAATATLAGTTLTYVVPLSELGRRPVVGLQVTTAGPTGGDRAPDAGLTQVRLAPSFTPAQPVHGKKFTVVGAATCAARIGTAKLRGRCAWTIPATAKGTTLVVTVGGTTFRFRVR